MMKSKIISCILVFMLIFTSSAFAKFDEYGYNAKACNFKGTMANWENFVYGRPAEPAEMGQLNVQYLDRKWSKDFDEMMFRGGEFVNGAWQKAHMYEYLSGEQLGWSRHESFKMVYSSTPVEGAMAVDEMPGFYIIEYKAWLEDPQGNEIIDFNFHSIPHGLGKGLYKNKN